MKIISYLKGNQISVGIVQGEMIVDVSEEFPDVLSIIKAGRNQGSRNLIGS